MGAIYFALVTGAETTFLPEYKREDEEVFDFDITHAEGDFAGLTIQILNPRIGLLHPDRNKWCWLVYESDVGTVTPLFFGRLVGVPSNMHEEIVNVDFIAKPRGYDDTKNTLAATLRVLPYFDPVWISEENREDADTVLEARTAHWHIDRITGAVTISDIIVGEDGVIEFNDESIFYDSLSINLPDTPLKSVTVEAEAHWTQKAAGSVDLSEMVGQAFKDAGSGNTQTMTTYTGDGFEKAWPTKGTDIGAGWVIGDNLLTQLNQWGQVVPEEEGETTAAAIEANAWNLGPSYFDHFTSRQRGFITGFFSGVRVEFPLWYFNIYLSVDYTAERSFVEKLNFTMNADMQAIFTDPDDDEENFTLSHSTISVSEPIDEGGEIPIGDGRRRSYFATDRGHRSLEWLILRARAELLQRSRAVEISFDVPFETALSLTCRHNVSLIDDRLPGGQAIGKVIGYSLFCKNGEFGATITIACAVGNGDSLSAIVGEPDYVDEDYVEEDYQFYFDSSVLLAGEVTYNDYVVVPNDDGLEFLDLMEAKDVLLELTDGLGLVVIGGKTEQEVILDDRTMLKWQQAADLLNELHTQLCIYLKPLNTGPFETEINITVSNLMVPKLIDLEAGMST